MVCKGLHQEPEPLQFYKAKGGGPVEGCKSVTLFRAPQPFSVYIFARLFDGKWKQGRPEVQTVTATAKVALYKSIFAYMLVVSFVYYVCFKNWNPRPTPQTLFHMKMISPGY